MKKIEWKKLYPHLAAIVIFLIVAMIYCKPVLEGRVADQHDHLGWQGMAQQSFEFKEKYGHFPLWTNSMFSGMPAYNIAMEPTQPVTIGPINQALSLWLPKPMNFFFLACICFYILTIVLKINPWLGITTALTFAYSTYDPIIIAVGHDTKMIAMAYMPAVLAGLLLLFRGNYLLGTALLSIFFGLQMGTQHLQITYYTFIILLAVGIAYMIRWIKAKAWTHMIRCIVLSIVAGGLGFATFAVVLLPLPEFAKETMRGGKSELTAPGGDAANKSKGGLDKDYAFNWSYGVTETFTLFVPGVYGGSNGGDEYNSQSHFAQKLQEVGIPEDNALSFANGSSYWGTQPSTSGPVYLGAIICFLFIFGMLYLKTEDRWWILAVTIFAILLAWGKNFAGFNYFIFDHLPFYNKFRAPSMSLVIPQLTFSVLAALALQQALFVESDKTNLLNKLKRAGIVTGIIAVVLVGFYCTADFGNSQKDGQLRDYFTSGMLQQATRSGQQVTPDAQQKASEFGRSMVSALHEDRKALFGGDLLRSILLVAAIAGLLVLYTKNKVSRTIVLAGVLLLSSFDLIAVGKRYLNDSKFVENDQFEATFVPTAADQQIKADPDKYYRVFDQTAGDPFSDSRASYFHNSIGGYSPAKLGLYEDLKEYQLQKGNMQVFNMLNTKYFIQRDPKTNQPVAARNPNAMGNCWIVKDLHYVANADDEMKALDSISVKDNAILQEKYKPAVKYAPIYDSTASISLLENLNDKINYTFSAKSNQFVVFSEVYYDKGWNAYIDGQKADYTKVDYVLRGLSVPAGNHTIEFRFEPLSYKIGNLLTLVASLIAYLLLAAAVIIELRKPKKI